MIIPQAVVDRLKAQWGKVIAEPIPGDMRDLLKRIDALERKQ